VDLIGGSLGCRGHAPPGKFLNVGSWKFVFLDFGGKNGRSFWTVLGRQESIVFL